MARKSATVTISGTENRDDGKVFLITEMPARQAEKWATRALNLMARSGVDLPPDILQAGMASMFVVGIRALTAIEYDGAEPLLDEMLTCVQRIPDTAKPSVVRAIHETDIEEVSTILKLRGEVFELHTGFSIAGGLSTLGSLAKRSNSNDTQISQEQSGQLSAEG